MVKRLYNEVRDSPVILNDFDELQEYFPNRPLGFKMKQLARGKSIVHKLVSTVIISRWIFMVTFLKI